jgi:hypothetical protein
MARWIVAALHSNVANGIIFGRFVRTAGRSLVCCCLARGWRSAKEYRHSVGTIPIRHHVDAALRTSDSRYRMPGGPGRIGEPGQCGSLARWQVISFPSRYTRSARQTLCRRLSGRPDRYKQACLTDRSSLANDTHLRRWKPARNSFFGCYTKRNILRCAHTYAIQPNISGSKSTARYSFQRFSARLVACFVTLWTAL